jgi:hypothetical protein
VNPLARQQQIAEAIDQREQKKAALLDRAIDLAGKEEAARYEALDKSPGKSAYAVGQPAYEARKERESIARTVEGLDAEIATLAAQGAEVAKQLAVEELQDYAGKAPTLTKREFKLYEKAGVLYEHLLALFEELAAVQEERAQHSFDVQRKDLVRHVADVQPGLVAKWGEVENSPLTPVGDFGAFLERLANGTSNPKIREADGGHNLEPGTHPSEILRGLLPDLRGRKRTCSVGTRSGPTAQIEGLRELGFGVGLPSGAV